MKQILLKEYVNYGLPTPNHFEISDYELDEKELSEGQVLISLSLVSTDPYLRGRISQSKSYAESYKLGTPMISFGIAKVLKSNNSNFSVGDYFVDQLEWKQKSIVTPSKFANKCDPRVPLPSYLSVLGLTGLTAYHGLFEIGKPKEGETLVVSGAAGATGSVVGQIGKIKGCRVVGIAGSDEKVKFLIEELGFDAAVNYKSPTYKQDLADACPKGVDIYFENVGGDVSDAVWPLLNFKARIPLCGVISAYNRTTPDVGPRNQVYILKTSSLMQGFIVTNYFSNNSEAIKNLSQWFTEGKIKDKHTINVGFDQIIPSFLSLFEGSNTGKMIVDVSKD